MSHSLISTCFSSWTYAQLVKNVEQAFSGSAVVYETNNAQWYIKTNVPVTTTLLETIKAAHRLIEPEISTVRFTYNNVLDANTFFKTEHYIWATLYEKS